MKILSVLLAVLLLLSCSGLTEPEDGATDSLWVFVYNGEVNSIKVEEISISFENVTKIDSTEEITEIDSITFDTTWTYDTTEVEEKVVTVDNTTEINLADSKVDDENGDALASYKLSINKEDRVVIGSSALEYEVVEEDTTIMKDIATYTTYAKEDYSYTKMFAETHSVQDTSIAYEYGFEVENE